MGNISLWVGCVFSIAYLVRILLYDGSNGPFESSTQFVVDDGTCEGPVNFFDHVRRLFGAYRVEDAAEGAKIWRTTIRMDVWRCPKCLSCWVAFVASVPFTIFLVSQGPANAALFPLVHLSIAFCAQFLVFTQLRIEGD